MTLLTEHQRAALKFDKHISLTANAGSGKTLVLSKRYLEIAMSQDYPNLRSIAAISFTDKASSELYKKIAGEADRLLESSDDPKVIRKLETIRRQLVSANISTIHSFCTDILRENPVEAGLDANFVPIDEILSDELIELSVDELVKNVFKSGAGEDKLKYLIRIYGAKSLLTRELISLVKRRKNILLLAEKIYDKNETAIAEFFRSSFEETSARIFSGKINEIIPLLKIVNDAAHNEKGGAEMAGIIAGHIESLESASSFSEKLRIVKDLETCILTKTGSVKKRGYLNKVAEDYRDETSLIEEFFSSLSKTFIEEDSGKVEQSLAVFGLNLLVFFRKALDRYNTKKKENGYLDYEDILLFTQKILENESVRESLSAKYKYIMIDEYQDTNEIQYNIFLPILNHLKRGNLFVVGDEKQSIYMFRDAELEVFDRTRNDIDKTEGENKLLTLPESFRMSPVIALFTNEMFRRIFSNPDPEFNEVEYNELVCASSTGEEGHVEIMLAPGKEDPENDETEDEQIAKKILYLSARGRESRINFSDIAILCRKRKEFKELENTLVKNQVPFTVVGGKGFYQRQSIYDVYNYFSFLLNREDDTALVGVLRSPFFNVPDSRILEISLSAGETYLQKLSGFSLNNAEMKKIFRMLEENLRLAASYDTTSLLRKILGETGYIPVLASRSNSAQELANIEKLINLTTAFGNQGFKTLYDYVDFLKKSINQLEDEAQAAIIDESDSVKIMTYHQAKGLEFKAVFLHNCSEPFRKESIKSKKVFADKKFGLLTRVPLDDNISAEYRSAPVVGLAEFIEERKNIAEFKRLFYVGVTRAVEYLYICGEKKKDLAFSKNSFMGMMSVLPGLDFSGESYPLKGRLRFTRVEGEKFVTEEKLLSAEIIISHESEKSVSPVKEKDENTSELKFNVGKITDTPEGEFISATKVAVFKQCPLKYQLTYEYGFTKLFSRYKNWNREQDDVSTSEKKYDFSHGEVAEDLINENQDRAAAGFADVKGRVIHNFLQSSEENNPEEFVERSIRNELNVFEYTEETARKLKDDIIADIKNYMSSVTFKEISSYKKFYNEYEIYLKENDYFLYGIIDKLIIDDEKAIIIDYKTDDIPAEKIGERSENYLPQLEFYSYIVGRFFPVVSNIDLRLIFIKHPEKPFTKSIKRANLGEISGNLSEMVTSVRNGNFGKNLRHCSKCLYSLDKKNCVINS